MNKEELLQKTSKEIEDALNERLSTISFKSEDASRVRGVMIDSIVGLFDNSIKVSIPYYTNREITLSVGKIDISFKVSTKNTGELVEVSRLRKKEIKTAGKFKLNDIRMSFYNPYFEGYDLDNYVVKASNYSSSGGASISLKHRKEKLIEMLIREVLSEEIQRQDDRWGDIRKTVVSNASQPKIRQEFYKQGFTQDRLDTILERTEEVNRGLIDSEVSKIFEVL